VHDQKSLETTALGHHTEHKGHLRLKMFEQQIMVEWLQALAVFFWDKDKQDN